MVWSDVAMATQVCVCKLTVPLNKVKLARAPHPKFTNQASCIHPSPPTQSLCTRPIMCIAILSYDVRLYQSPYRITVEDIVLIRLHNFEWCTLTRIHNIEQFFIVRTHTQHTHNEVIFCPIPIPRLLSGNRTRDCFLCGQLIGANVWSLQFVLDSGKWRIFTSVSCLPEMALTERFSVTNLKSQKPNKEGFSGFSVGCCINREKQRERLSVTGLSW